MSELPAPLTPADCDLSDVPMPRELLIRLLMEALFMTKKEADLYLTEFFAGLPQ